jgi:hypothetical protein
MTATATVARIERVESEISVLNCDAEVLLVWRVGGQIDDECFGFKRKEYRRCRRGSGLDHDFEVLYAYRAHGWVPLWKRDWPTHFVPTLQIRGAGQFTRPTLEGPPPMLTDREAELAARVKRAFEIDNGLGDREKAWLSRESWWPETRPGPGDYPSDGKKHHRATHKEMSDYMVVMSWLAAVKRYDAAAGIREREGHYRVLNLVAYGVPFRSVGDKIGRSEDTANKRWSAALRLVAEFAATDHVEAFEKGARRVGDGRRRGHR